MSSNIYRYRNDDVVIGKSHYIHGGRILLQLNTPSGEPLARATVNLPNVPLSGKEIIIKNYSENEGILEFLQNNGIVGPVKRLVPTGWVLCPVVELLKNEEGFEDLDAFSKIF